ncbi:M28 family peptidase [Pseudonocardiaceae bacterium YIM PH 21723]|nr:M28 family peptidase [Pseudonocardiaceae bacterium YIM PH 21723]
MKAGVYMSRSSRALVSLVATGALVLSLGTAAAAPAPPLPSDASALAKQLATSVTTDGTLRHLRALQRIADTHGGTRDTATPGYAASVEYVAGKLRDAGFLVDTPEFPYDEGVTEAAGLTVGSSKPAVAPALYTVNTPAGGLTAPLAVAPTDDASPGCEASDYANTPVKGSIVLVRRGSCVINQKQRVAAQLGAVGVLVAQYVDSTDLRASLGSPDGVTIPVGVVSRVDGDKLAGQAGTPATLELKARIDHRTAKNITAQTRTGRADNVVMATAHLDSVLAGPGINDDGSGTSALLETALRLGSTPKVNNAVRFAWWGGEERGLLGSSHYAASLSEDQALDVALMLDFDMIASPNAAYFVYDGDDSDHTGAGPGPQGSGHIEKTFTDYYKNLGIETEGYDFDGRSDYVGFTERGIPAGGPYSGAEGIKTDAQVKKWGGTVGKQFDPCYHQACDTLANINTKVLGQSLGAIALVIGNYATSTEPINGRSVRRMQTRIADTRGVVARQEVADQI